jgi:predicted nucleic acid-binding protein
VATVNKRCVILDTGPLVAFLNRQDKYHRWALIQWEMLQPPLLTCEAVLSEACFLLSGASRGQNAVIALMQRNVLQVPFALADHTDRVGRLLQKYADAPMSLADACLVRMAELFPDSKVMTLDSDFQFYRKNKSRVIPAISPYTR